MTTCGAAESRNRDKTKTREKRGHCDFGVMGFGFCIRAEGVQPSATADAEPGHWHSIYMHIRISCHCPCQGNKRPPIRATHVTVTLPKSLLLLLPMLGSRVMALWALLRVSCTCLHAFDARLHFMYVS